MTRVESTVAGWLREIPQGGEPRTKPTGTPWLGSKEQRSLGSELQGDREGRGPRSSGCSEVTKARTGETLRGFGLQYSMLII